MDITLRHWKFVLFAACITLVSSAVAVDICVPAQLQLGGSAAPLNDHDAEGKKAAARLTARYLDRQSDCGGPSRPLFLCSAVLLRGVARTVDRYDTGLAFQPWMPNRRKSTVDSEKPPHPEGVSTSLMRADFQFNALAYGYTAGLFFYPPMDRPAETTAITVICGYPIDAATNERGHITYPYNTGCIRHYSYDPVSGPCNDTEKAHPGDAIDTPEEWMALYGPYAAKGIDPHRKQCSFVMLDVTPKWEDENWGLVRTELNADSPEPGYGPNASADFLDVVQAMHAMNARSPNPLKGESFNVQNELMVAAWDIVPSSDAAEASPAYREALARRERQTPIEAFFYVPGQAQALVNARVMQKTFEQRTGIWRPIIRFTLAPSADKRASFTYASADQSP